MGYEFGLAKRIYGVVPGVVMDNKHPEGAYRVKIKFPWIKSTDAGDDADYVSSWARVISPMAGGGRGFYCLPEVGDEVVVSFVHGDIRYPMVLGAVWSDTDKAPTNDKGPKASTDPLGNDLGIVNAVKDNKAQSGKNNARYWYTRNGSGLVFDDTSGKEKVSIFTKKGSMLNINDEKDVIAIYDSKGETYLTLDAKKKDITLESKNGNIFVYAKKGKFYLEANEIITKSKAKQEHKAGSTWKQESGGTMDMKAGGTMTLKAPKIDLNP